MTVSFAGWSPVGIVALIAIVAGIVLLVAYAVQRGLVHRELDGIETPPREPEGTMPAAAGAAAAASRTLGIAGCDRCWSSGLALGAIAAVVSWATGDATTGGPGPRPARTAPSPGTAARKATPNP